MKIKINLWNNRWLWTLVLLCVAVLFSCLQPLQFVEGGEFTFFSMLALVLIGYFFGWKQMILSCAAFILIRLWIDWPFPGLKPEAEVADYIFGYGVLSVGGIVAHKTKNLRTGYVVAVFLRYIESVINCLLFHYIATDSVWANIEEAFGYSALYVISEFLVTMVVLMIPAVMEAIEYWRYMATNKMKVDLDTY